MIRIAKTDRQTDIVTYRVATQPKIGILEDKLKKENGPKKEDNLKNQDEPKSKGDIKRDNQTEVKTTSKRKITPKITLIDVVYCAIL